MKSRWIFSAAALVLAAGPVKCSLADGTRGGGDPCEDRIQIVRDDLQAWIAAGGPNGLILSGRVTVDSYSKQMLESIRSAKVKCVKPGDSGYPVTVNGTPKVCRFDKTSDQTQITCTYDAFVGQTSLNQTDQYVLIHHEYAGLSGLENPMGDVSTYGISNQISAFLVDQVVKKLAVKPNNGTHVSVTGAVFTSDNSIPSLGEAYRDPSGLIWGKVNSVEEMMDFNLEDPTGDYCEYLGKSHGVQLRTPTNADFEHLASYLGYGTSQGYSPYTADGKTAVLSDNLQILLTSTFCPDQCRYIFIPGDGIVDDESTAAFLLTKGRPIRCVSVGAL